MTEAFIKVLAKQYNKTDVEIKDLIFNKNEKGEYTELKDNADEILLSMYADQVKSWKNKATETGDRAANEATKRIHTQYEQKIKEHFNIADDLKGDDLFNKAVETYKAAASGTGKGKSSPEYLELESKYKKVETDFNGFKQQVTTDYVPKAEVERKGRLSVAQSFVTRKVASMKLVPAPNEAIQQNLMKNCINDICSRYDDVQEGADGKLYAMKNGERIENKLGQAVELSEIAEEVAMGYWVPAAQDPTGQANNKNIPGGGGATGDMSKYQAILDNPKSTREEKLAAAEALDELKHPKPAKK